MADFKKYREACGLKQAEAARLLGLSSRKVLNNYEAGLRTPNLETVLKMSELYGVPSYVLLGLDENAPDAEIRSALVEQVLKMPPRQMQMLLGYLEKTRREAEEGPDFPARSESEE